MHRLFELENKMWENQILHKRSQGTYKIYLTLKWINTTDGHGIISPPI